MDYAVHGVANSQTGLSNFHFHFSFTFTVESTVVQYLHFKPKVPRSKYESSRGMAGMTVFFRLPWRLR